MNREVKHAQLHAVPFVAGCGQLKANLAAQEYTGMKMLWTSDGLLVDYKNVSFLVPAANVVCVTLADSSSAAKENAPLKPVKAS